MRAIAATNTFFFWGMVMHDKAIRDIHQGSANEHQGGFMFYCFSKGPNKRFFSTVLILLMVAFVSLAQAQRSSSTSTRVNAIVEKANSRGVEPSKEAQQDYAEVAARLEEKLNSTPQDAMLRNNLGAAYAFLGRFEDAQRELQKAIELDSQIALFHRNLSIVFESLERPQDALTAVLRSLELDPRNMNSHTLHCKLNLVTERFQEAASCYEHLLTMSQPDVKLLTAYNIALLNTENVDKALRLAQETVTLFPAEATAHNSLGAALYAKKKYKKAVASFSRAVEIDPKFHAARFNLALSHLADKNKADTMKQYFVMKNSNDEYARRLYQIINQDKVVYVGQR